jgi:F0F1-type ATP synthase membrane subunit b/b'
MARGARKIAVGLFSLIVVFSLLVGGCTRYAKEEQLQALDESEASAVAAEENVAKLEKEKAELEAKLAEKQQELEQVKAEKARIASQLAESAESEVAE